MRASDIFWLLLWVALIPLAILFAISDNNPLFFPIVIFVLVILTGN